MSQRLWRFLPVLCLSVHAWTAAFGQVAFEVASIKPSPPPAPNPFGFPTAASIGMGAGGSVDATQATLFDLILRAYDLHDFQVAGGPKWMTFDRFDVTARAAAGFAGDTSQIRTMMRAVLAERFHLRVHTEVRELPIYHLVLARRDGRLGRQLRPSSVDCTAGCAPSFKVDMKGGTMTIQLQGQSMAELVRQLSLPEARRVVRDKTGLAGSFDLELTFAPEPPPGFPRLPGSENGVSLFTALQEQLGLRLEPGRGPVDVIVVDSAEHPTEN